MCSAVRWPNHARRFHTDCEDPRIHQPAQPTAEWKSGTGIDHGLKATMLGLSLGSRWGVCLAVIFWIGTVAVLQRMGKADPRLRQVYLRHIRNRQFYPAT